MREIFINKQLKKMSEITKNITLSKFNPEWKNQFQIEADIIKSALYDNCIHIHHIGSTSIPDLIAKPKIDILVVVKNTLQIIEQFEKIQYRYRGEYNIPMQYCFTKRDKIDVNVHAYEDGHPEILLNLMFRDYLRKNDNAKKQYANLKHHLTQNSSSFIKNNLGFTNYTLKKGDFIREILKQAGFCSCRISKCNDATEISAVSGFQKRYLSQSVIEFNENCNHNIILYKGTTIAGYAYIDERIVHVVCGEDCCDVSEKQLFKNDIKEENILKRICNIDEYLTLLKKWLTYSEFFGDLDKFVFKFYR